MEISNAEKIFQSVQRLGKVSFTQDKSCDLTHSEIRMMQMIRLNCKDDEGVKIASIASKLMISGPAVSKMINGLEDRGYVERVTKKSDRRVVYVKLTEVGTKRLDETFKMVLDVANIILERMGEEDTNTLIRLLDKLYHIIDDFRKEE